MFENIHYECKLFSNPQVQVAVLENLLLQPLLHHLTYNEDLTERSRMLYALSCLIRHFPVAQETFVTHGGIQVV